MTKLLMSKHEAFLLQPLILMSLHLSYLQFISKYCPSKVQINCQNIQGLSSNDI